MDNVEYLNNLILNCSPINFNSSNSHNISFDAKIEVVSYNNGPVLTYGELIIAYWSGSAEHIYQTIPINEYDWVYDELASKAYYELPLNITLYSSDFEDTNGGSVYIRYAESINHFYKQSCIYNVTKPKFSISPNNTSVVCGSSSHKTFYVYNNNNSPGDLEYEWNLGSGWSYNGNPTSTIITTSNHISLTPNIFPPSDVKVTPILDYIDYPQLVSDVELIEFNPDNVISGNKTVCSSANYSINNLPYGVSVASWSVSDSSIASISTNGNQAILTATGNGTVSISATLTNVCGQTKIIEKNNIFVGAPDFPSYPAMSGDNNPMVGEYKWYSVTGAEGASSYNWYFDVGNGVTGNTC
ncbi:hypothetical protein [Xanthomarina sp.]|uniref:hypothetical protein n=1 Tax=Xanthomarina sp. TaxID=1931211 RepID=UPI002D0B909C|nr:hypothetical protein [Xanthomarina sp.]HLV38410.1 hypothetical protein [Xanthomarina sp.]